MKRVFQIVICAGFLLAAALPTFAGEVIDGVVATVNHAPVLRSDWEEAVSFEAFMQQKALRQMSEAERAVALQRLIDRQLLKGQMVDTHHLQPSGDARQQELAKLRAQVPNGNDDATWHNLLDSYGLNEELVKEHLRDELQVMNFVEVRLRPNVHIQDEEIEAYYNRQLLPDLKVQGGKKIPLDEVVPAIRELLTQQRIDELLDTWLHNLRQQAEIHSTVAIPGISVHPDQQGASPSH